jgi:hypothetical protein
MYRALLAHSHEVLYCLVSRYGNESVRYGVWWFGVFGLSTAGTISFTTTADQAV